MCAGGKSCERYFIRFDGKLAFQVIRINLDERGIYGLNLRRRFLLGLLSIQIPSAAEWCGFPAKEWLIAFETMNSNFSAGCLDFAICYRSKVVIPSHH